MIKRYRKKPIEIDAVQWNGDNLAELRKMEGFDSVHTCFRGRLSIKTCEGIMLAKRGDYIIKGVQGEFYPCKPVIFEQTYEEVKDGKTEEQQTIEPEQPHWIPCSERLPEDVEIGEKYPTVIFRTKDAVYAGSYEHYKWWDTEGYYVVNNVIAWMPSPKYIEESEEC